ncbi:FAD-dependent oxidoreductase [Piscinibacterium candidicorallinum]|uniref:FAD-dependent oxidoreductase n=1 Tax=Piscinibacterium candidicorallinum TaxID=1793872 RepID=A0ABV7H1V0_9BURK
MKRREFLAAGSAGALSAALAACGRKPDEIPIEFAGYDPARAHALREPWRAPAGITPRKTEVLVVGGGIAGLSAAWWLAREARAQVTLLEMEPTVGGNARGLAEHPALSDPCALGAHYLPSPSRQATELRLLLADVGVIRGDAFRPQPDYDPRAVNFAPQERLWMDARGEHAAGWQEGLLPLAEPASRTMAQYKQFAALIEDLMATGAFTMPSRLDAAALPSQVRALDASSFSDWLLSRGLDDADLHWYADYCCRDDYGTRAAETSAFAGVAYFAARHGFHADPREEGRVGADNPTLTWPTGNGAVAEKMREYIAARQASAIQTGCRVRRVAEVRGGVEVDCERIEGGRTAAVERWQAARVIIATPARTLPFLVEACPAPWLAATKSLSYAPWLTVNLGLSFVPGSTDGSPLAWDNVFKDSLSLGYVNAAHQSLHTRRTRTVWTWYRALAEQAPGVARKRLLDAPARAWVDEAVADILHAHPAAGAALEGAVVSRFGHAMARPAPGVMLGDAVASLRVPVGRIALAHSDLAGYSVFEEAQRFGVRAARWALQG